jgi:peptidyl-prolyl cis-trans isomerase SurA
VRDSLLDGGDFADFAKRYSSDFGSAEDGGVLGFTEKGMFVKEYEKVAFTLQPGELSKPVETPFGFHLIELIAKRDNAVNTRHILFKIGATADDKQKVMDFLDSLRKEVMDGKEDFEEIAKQYSEEEETRSFGGYLQRRPMEQLLDMTDVVNGLKDGEVSKARPYTKDPTKTAFHIIYRKKTYEPHVMSLEQDYKNIEQAALFFKRNEQYKKWLQELRQEIYWEIKKD